jgi:Holliday junction DNA helicase RuvA
MLGSLNGLVLTHLDQRVLIEVQGVGYWVFTGSWHPTGEVRCFLHHVVREDVSDLYGFETLGGLSLFERLISISGIGPKAALALLSVGDAERIQRAIQDKDTAFLSSAPGIGQKAAQKIILELHGKLDSINSLFGDDSSGGHADLIAALTGLGYKTHEIRPLLGQIPAELSTVDEQLRWALKSL